ncbi:MAG: molybdenum cofactor biosynthesis protein MoaE [Alphaproteobacteria bacterium TMED89]|nr:MAG: molybdenum cofactor biosynthesis protein MoaE [Alphaproteobacteria bacterium TMED89]
MRQLNGFEGRRHRGVDPCRIEQRRRIQPRIDSHHVEFEPPQGDEEIASSGSIQFPGSGARLAGGDLHPWNPQRRDDPESGAGLGRQWCEGQPQSSAGIVGTGHRPTISRPVVYDSEMSGTAPESDVPRPPEGVHVAIEPGGLAPGDPDAFRGTGEAIGGECVFRGRTRPEAHPEHGELVALDYEAHPTLAIRSLRTIAIEVMATFDLSSLSIRHASGPVAIGETSVEIVAIAGHRDAAFRGCREAIDRLKRETPIWKKERWTGTATWSDAATPIEAPRHEPGDHP